MNTRRDALKTIAGAATLMAVPALAGDAPKRLVVRPAGARGHANHGWLDTHHTFSFARYRDPRYMGFGALRVINEDRVVGGRGFGMHPHRDMEILTWVLDGELQHKDTLGNGSLIQPGDIQHMSAGRGIRHSEFNPSDQNGVHFLQIWVKPETHGLTPSYGQLYVPKEKREGRLYPLANRKGGKGTIRVNQNVALYNAVLPVGAKVSHTLEPGRRAWIQVARGEVVVEGVTLRAGDGASTVHDGPLRIQATKAAEVLLFDLA